MLCCISKLTIDGTANGEKWPRFDTKNMKYVLIKTSKTVISKEPYMDEYKFWKNLPISTKNQQSKVFLESKNEL